MLLPAGTNTETMKMMVYSEPSEIHATSRRSSPKPGNYFAVPFHPPPPVSKLYLHPLSRSFGAGLLPLGADGVGTRFRGACLKRLNDPNQGYPNFCQEEDPGRIAPSVWIRGPPPPRLYRLLIIHVLILVILVALLPSLSPLLLTAASPAWRRPDLLTEAQTKRIVVRPPSDRPWLTPNRYHPCFSYFWHHHQPAAMTSYTIVGEEETHAWGNNTQTEGKWAAEI